MLYGGKFGNIYLCQTDISVKLAHWLLPKLMKQTSIFSK